MRLQPQLALGGLVALGLLAGGYLAAQQLVSRSLTGNEVIVAAIGGPGGSSLFVPTAQARGAPGTTTTAATTGTLSTLTTTTNYLISTAAAGGSMVVNLPALPYDGEIFAWCNGAAGAFTTGNTVATTDSSTIQGANTTGALAAAACIEFRYTIGSAIWYKVR